MAKQQTLPMVRCRKEPRVASAQGGLALGYDVEPLQGKCTYTCIICRNAKPPGGFVNPSPFYVRHGRLICAVALLLMPLLWYGAISAFLTNTNNVLDWLPDSFEETQRLFRFVQRFGTDELLVLSWEGCTLEDRRLDEVANSLIAPVSNPETGESVQWFGKVFTGRDTLAELTSKPLELSRTEALRRIEGWLVAPDGETSCALATVTLEGALNRVAAIEHVRQVTEAAGIDWQTVRMGGPTSNAVAIDEASNSRIAEMAVGSALLGMAVAWKCLGSIRLVLFIVFSAVIAWGASLSTVFFSGTNMDAVLLIMPALVFVLAVSGGVHLTNYFTDALSESNNYLTAGATAIRLGALPCVLASATTAIGLGSLLSSQLIPVRKFGFFTSLGMLFVIIALMLVWPALVSCFPRERSQTEPEERRSKRDRWWLPLYWISSRHSTTLLLAYLMAIPALGWGVMQIKSSVQLEDLLGAHSAPIQKSRWLEERFGSLVPVEVVLSFDKTEKDDWLALLLRVKIVEELRAQLEESPRIDSAIAATTFAPTLPASSSARDLLTRRVIAARLSKHRDRFEAIHFLHDEQDRQHWRISTRVAADSLEEGRILADIQQQIDAFLKSPNLLGDIPTAEVSGGIPLITMAQQQLLEDLARSFLLAFLLIGLTMMVLVRSAGAGILTMAPNVFPALVTFGCMGLLGIAVDIGTMMTASAALGIAVDDTLHFLVWFRRGLQRGFPRKRAVRFAFLHCATAMLQTSLICGLGLLVFLVSSFAPIARFGAVMATMLALALVGDLLVLPAMLCSALGKSFVKKDYSGKAGI